MKKSDLQTFQPQCKMTRPGPNLALPPQEPHIVKFKELLYTPNAEEPILVVNVERNVQTSQVPKEETPLSPDEEQFFKDPLREINEDKMDNAEDQEKPPEIKLGHNMRASVGGRGRKNKTTPLEIMEARRSLLEKMKEQREACGRRELATEDAKVIVNQLVAHGFQIAPPSEHPRFETATPMTTASAGFIPNGSTSEAEIVRSINNEVERVQKFNQVPL